MRKIGYFVILILGLMILPIVPGNPAEQDVQNSTKISALPLTYASYFGGNGTDTFIEMTLDTDNNIYITGYTTSIDFPTTTNAYNQTKSGGIQSGQSLKVDVFVSKFSPDGTSLIFSTFLGVTGVLFSPIPSRLTIALDSANNIVIVGSTTDATFPTTTDAYNQTHSGGNDIFISKLSNDGSNLLYSSFLGGSGFDGFAKVALDADDNLYIVGETTSSNFPTTADAYNQTHSGASDIFLSKLSANGSTLLYSTFIGGTGNDYFPSITLDAASNVYLTGSTSSSDYPTTTDAYNQTYNGGGSDIFVSTFSASSGYNISYSTFIGGTMDDGANAITLDSANNMYIVGPTNSADFPTSANAFDTTYNGNSNSLLPIVGDVFVTKLSADGSSLSYSTYLGGSAQENSLFIILDDANNAIITGFTGSTDFPTTSDAYDTSHNGGDEDPGNWDAFIAQISADGTALSYSTFIGGSDDDFGGPLMIDSWGNWYVTGRTDSIDFPLSANAYQSIPNHDASLLGRSDAFIVKFGDLKAPETTTTSTTTPPTSPPTTTTPTTTSGISIFSIEILLSLVSLLVLYRIRKKR